METHSKYMKKYAIGTSLTFLDDGKESRPYDAKVVGYVTLEDAKNVKIDDIYNGEVTTTLYDIWKNRIITDEFNSNLYDFDTDEFMVCSIPEYDDNLVYFARSATPYFSWFSFDTDGTWMSGGIKEGN